MDASNSSDVMRTYMRVCCQSVKCMLQLLKNLRRSVTTLDICGEWGTGDSANDEAALEVKTDRVWMEGRAQQKRLSALQVSLPASAL